MLERREPTAVGVDGCGARSHGTIPKGKRRAGTLAIQRFDYVLSVWKDLAGGEVVEFSNATYLSERATANRNRALAHLLVRAWGFYSQRRRRRPLRPPRLTRSNDVVLRVAQRHHRTGAARAAGGGGACSLARIQIVVQRGQPQRHARPVFYVLLDRHHGHAAGSGRRDAGKRWRVPNDGPAHLPAGHRAQLPLAHGHVWSVRLLGRVRLHDGLPIQVGRCWRAHDCHPQCRGSVRRRVLVLSRGMRLAPLTV